MRLEEFKDYCKTITREEFLEDCEDSNFGEHELNCPGDTGAIELKNACGVGSCKYCWEEAVKDIKFKGEEDIMENSNKPKTYKTWEVIKMLSENPKLRFRDCSYETVVIVGTGKGSLGTSFLEVCESSFGDKTLDGNVDLESEWTLIQQEPVDFMTAVKSGKRIRIEHELEITKLICKELLKLSMNERNLLFNSFYYDFDCFSNNKCKDCLIENPNKCVRKEV